MRSRINDLKFVEFDLNKKKLQLMSILFFVAYTIFVVWMTLLKREPRVRARVIKPELFWAFRGWINGAPDGKQESIQYIQNVLFFIPFGFLFPWKKWKPVFMSALMTSAIIEATQYIFNLGWCELDDVISNTAGALIGFGCYVIVQKLIYKGENRVG